MCFGDQWLTESHLIWLCLAEAWVKLSSQRLILRDEQCQNYTMTGALIASQRRRNPIGLFGYFWAEAAEEDLRLEVQKVPFDEVWDDSADTLWKTKGTRADTVRLFGNFIDPSL